MKKRLWHSYLNEGGGKGTVVVFDHLAALAPDDYVYLFNFERKEIVKYKKDIVRSKLRPLSEIEKVSLSAVDSAYFQAQLEKEKILQKKESSSFAYGVFYSVLGEHDSQDGQSETEEESHDSKEARKEIEEELWDYAESIERSEEDGWFYNNTEGGVEDNMVDPNSENA